MDAEVLISSFACEFYPSTFKCNSGLLEEYFGKPIRNTALSNVHKINPKITISDVKGLSDAINEHEYAFLSYVYIAATHQDAIAEFPNKFSHLQTLTALRNLSALLEVRLKTLNKDLKQTLFPTVQSLFKSSVWWNEFEKTRKLVGATKNSRVPVDTQITNTLKLVPPDDSALFWKSLLIAYITRNFTAHQMDTSSTIIRIHSSEILANILNVMVFVENFV